MTRPHAVAETEFFTSVTRQAQRRFQRAPLADTRTAQSAGLAILPHLNICESSITVSCPICASHHQVLSVNNRNAVIHQFC